MKICYKVVFWNDILFPCTIYNIKLYIYRHFQVTEFCKSTPASPMTFIFLETGTVPF